MSRRTNLALGTLSILTSAALVLAGEDARTFPAKGGGKLRLDLKAGAVVAIEGSGGSSVEVMHSGCTAPCELQFEETKDGIAIRATFTKEPKWQSSNVELSVKVPAQFDVEIDSTGGGISIDGVEGKFTGKTMGGELTLRRVRGEAELSTMGGDIELSDSDLDGFLKTMGGDVSFENVVGDVRGSSMGGNVSYRNVQTRGGRLASPEHLGEGIDDIDPETVQISTMGGTIEVEEAPEGADLYTMGGDIDVRGVRRFVRAQTMGGNIEIRSIDGWVQATSMGGNIEVHVSGDDKVVLTSMSGNVELWVPAGSGMDLDLEIAYTRNSEQDFKIVAPGSLKQSVTPDWEYAHGELRKYIRMSGPVNGGGHAVKIRTVNGSVELKEER